MGLIRFLLAISVVMSHSGGFAGYALAGGDIAVQTFFMISGFLIQLVLSGRYDPQTQRALFYGNRALRLFPLYFIALAANLTLGLLLPGRASYWTFLQSRMASLSEADIIWLALTAVVIVGQESFLFLSQGTHGLVLTGHIDERVWRLQPVPQAWSLSLELVFYALAPLLARVSDRVLVALIFSGFALKLALALGGLDFDPWTGRFLPTSLPMFLLGMLACRWRNQLTAWHMTRRVVPVAFLATTFVVSLRHAIGVRLGAPPAFIEGVYYALAWISLPALFAWSSLSGARLWRAVDGRLAELSYPIYISHWFVIMFVLGLWPAAEGVEKGLRSLLVIALTLMIGWTAVLLVERPIDAWRARRRTARS